MSSHSAAERTILSLPEKASTVPTAHHLLIVEDETLTREMLRLFLEEDGFMVSTAATVQGMASLLATEPVDLILLNIGLPDGNGLVHLQQLPEDQRPPVMCISADSQEDSRVMALEAGAEDFLTKPLNERELSVRLRNLLRRRIRATDAIIHDGLVFGSWRLDLAKERLTDTSGKAEHLTTTEFKLLLAMATNPNRPLSREWLSQTVLRRPWRAEDRSLDVLVGRLRRKLESRKDGREYVRSVRYVGYRFDAEVESDSSIPAGTA